MAKEKLRKKYMMLGVVIMVGIGITLSGCGDEKGNGFKDNKDVISDLNEDGKKDYKDVALRVLEERYGEKFEIKQVGSTFAGKKGGKKLICNPISNPDKFCFVEVDTKSLEVYDDYTNRIMEEKLGTLLDENSKDIFGENVIVKPTFNPIYDKYKFSDMDPIEFFKENTLSGYAIGIFIKSDGDINKNEEAIKVEKFMNRLIALKLNKNSMIAAWYCKEEIYNNVDNKFYELQLRNNVVDFYDDIQNSYNSTYGEIEDKKLKQSAKEIEDNFKY
ncbi:hypothetical protein [Clostridium gasigenes]|uniref:Lipoprotein n=1 Tax=Clostridium gasigenes TaxID=94869 RepID=A0A7X0SI88_9CLOT|nr:hypothetical protein [Clostridium gasigenes]MBB6716887.1 hypothetical protein [Clostridium gasigenes]